MISFQSNKRCRCYTAENSQQEWWNHTKGSVNFVLADQIDTSDSHHSLIYGEYEDKDNKQESNECEENACLSIWGKEDISYKAE